GGELRREALDEAVPGLRAGGLGREALVLGLEPRDLLGRARRGLAQDGDRVLVLGEPVSLLVGELLELADLGRQALVAFERLDALLELSDPQALGVERGFGGLPLLRGVL